jgi:hypothetical protein
VLHARCCAILIATILAALAIPPAASAATRLVAPSGSNGGNCLAAPCASLVRAYNVAGAGDVISVAAGVYPRQQLPDGSKAVTFRGAAGNKVRQIYNNASNVTFDGIEIDAGFTTPDGAAFDSHGSGVTFKNGRIGNVIDQKGALLGGWNTTASQRVVFDNVVFHDVYQVGDAVHNECIYSQAPGLTVRNSSFRNCATMDLMVTRGDWWGQPAYGGVTLINNVFAHSVNGRDPDWHYYGFLLHGNMGQLTNVRVINNTFETPVGGVTSHDVNAASGVWANNIGGGWECLPGITYSGNVGKKCSASDVAVSPSDSCAPPACNPPHTMPVGWVNPAVFDFTLKAGSRAINVANPAYAPATDRRGYARDGRPDAGAYEYGAGPASGPPTAGTGSWRLAFAKLTKRTICRTPRRRCPSSTKLRLTLGRPAAVAVRVARLRKGKAPKRVRTKLLRQVRLHKATRIRARGLRPGRYRITVRATDATGLRSKPRRLRLRVLR